MIAQERLSIADILTELTEQQWNAQSLCTEWKVRDVAAHLLMPLVVSGARFGVELVLAGFDFNKANLRLTARVAQRDNAEIIAGLREHASNRFKPPGMGPVAPLTDCIVHGQDMWRPLGIDHHIDAERQRLVLDFVAGGRVKGWVPENRLFGLRFQATDMDWALGEGEPIEGPAEALMMAVTGRTAALDDLIASPGVDVLRSRLPMPGAR